MTWRNPLKLFSSPLPAMVWIVCLLSPYVSAASPSVLECVQVTSPVPASPDGACQQVLMNHSFAFSYGLPFVGAYTLPPCAFNKVLLNLTVVSAGRQFDRLAVMYLGDVEIFRTSTAEPTNSGIIWTYHKDMSHHLSLFQEPQKIIFDLGNLVDDTYTAAFNATLTATFFTDSTERLAETPAPADIILPISARRSGENAPSAFSLPDQKAINTLVIPRNIKKAIVSISACGQIGEEFWWSNVPSSRTSTFPQTGDLLGHSPFREIQLYIDGTLAGVAWPFPVIFTGGVAPGLWRPLVGIDAFDLRDDEVDISPWLGLLCDGSAHTFELRIAGIEEDLHGHPAVVPIGGPGYWIVSGKVFLWLDSNDSITTGAPPVIHAPTPTLWVNSTVDHKVDGSNVTLSYIVKAHRHISITSHIWTSHGSQLVSWNQTLGFSNSGNITNEGRDQVNHQLIHGDDLSNEYRRAFSYPMKVSTSYLTDQESGNFSIDATIDWGKHVSLLGQLSSPLESWGLGHENDPRMERGEKIMHTRQNGSATYLAVPALRMSFSSGATEQNFDLQYLPKSSFLSIQDESHTPRPVDFYHRHVLAVNGTLIKDEENISGHNHMDHYTEVATSKEFAGSGIRDILGRGPSR